MRMSIVISVAMLCLLAAGPSAAQNADSARSQAADSIVVANPSGEGLEIDRLIVDETISKAGHEFLELFFNLWNWPEVSNGTFMMTVTERPFRGISTQVVITINDLVVFESFLQSRYEYLEYLAASAVEQSTTYLLSYYTITQQLKEVDLEGTGIY